MNENVPQLHLFLCYTGSFFDEKLFISQIAGYRIVPYHPSVLIDCFHYYKPLWHTLMLSSQKYLKNFRLTPDGIHCNFMRKILDHGEKTFTTSLKLAWNHINLYKKINLFWSMFSCVLKWQFIFAQEIAYFSKKISFGYKIVSTMLHIISYRVYFCHLRTFRPYAKFSSKVSGKHQSYFWWLTLLLYEKNQ